MSQRWERIRGRGSRGGGGGMEKVYRDNLGGGRISVWDKENYGREEEKRE